ncbi:MAG: type III pantothenate kinase [Geminicoccaceae bacterium]
MLMAIDVGNTNTVIGLYEGEESRAQWRLQTMRQRTSDEYAVAVVQLMQFKGFQPEDVKAVVMATVVPQVVFPMRKMFRDHFGVQVLVVGEDLDYGMPIALNNPSEVGADRVVNAVAAWKRYARPLIIVDFGTATTFDVVDGEGVYRGGAIAPGINLSIEALHQAAAQLPRIGIERPEHVIGTSTVTAMQSGVFYGYVALIEGLITRIRQEFGAPMKVVATGGLAGLFSMAVPMIEQVDRDLTMTGLVDIYRRNPPPSQD